MTFIPITSQEELNEVIGKIRRGDKEKTSQARSEAREWKRQARKWEDRAKENRAQVFAMKDQLHKSQQLLISQTNFVEIIRQGIREELSTQGEK